MRLRWFIPLMTAGILGLILVCYLLVTVMFEPPIMVDTAPLVADPASINSAGMP